MKKLLILTIIIVITQTLYAQVGHGTNNPHHRAVLDLATTDKALYLPRMTNAQIFAHNDWEEGMILFIRPMIVFISELAQAGCVY